MASFVWTEVSSAWNAGKGMSSLLISSWENLNPMQALPPPLKVILNRAMCVRFYPPCQGSRMTHKCEYTPGIFASATELGSPSIHLSGFHSNESGPQISGLQFDERRDGNTTVPFGTRTSCISEPSFPRTGFENGRMMSSRVLE